jgi:uncharacterized protein YggE
MRTVTVTGRGSAQVAPDVAVVRVSAVHRAPAVAEALAGASSAAGAIAGVARRHAEGDQVATSELHVWPHHDDDGRRSGFEARHGLTVRCPDVDGASRMLAELAEEVGDRLWIDGVGLEVRDPQEAEGRARDAAYADAHARATRLAALAGATLGEVQDIAEGGAAVPRAALAMAAAAARSDAGIEPGLATTTAAVTVTWQLV